VPRMFGPWSGLTVTAAVVLAVDAVDGDSLALAFGAGMLGKGGSPKVEACSFVYQASFKHRDGGIIWAASSRGRCIVCSAAYRLSG